MPGETSYQRLSTTETGRSKDDISLRLLPDYEIRNRTRSLSGGSVDLAKFKGKRYRRKSIQHQKPRHSSVGSIDLENLLKSEAEASSDDDDETDTNGNKTERKKSKKWTREQWLVLVTQLMYCFISTVAYSLLSPFFPQEAKKKNISSVTTGLIFGFFELVIFIASPIIGSQVGIHSPSKRKVRYRSAFTLIKYSLSTEKSLCML